MPRKHFLDTRRGGVAQALGQYPHRNPLAKPARKRYRRPLSPVRLPIVDKVEAPKNPVAKMAAVSPIRCPPTEHRKHPPLQYNKLYIGRPPRNRHQMPPAPVRLPSIDKVEPPKNPIPKMPTGSPVQRPPAKQPPLSPRKYTKLNTVGKGGFGKVYRGHAPNTNQEVAIKYIDLRKIPKQHALKEVALLEKMSHPNVIKYHASKTYATQLCVVMEFVDGQDLADHVIFKGRLSEQKAKPLVTQLLHALSYLHENNIAHRDIKPANIMLDKKGGLKLVDFGLGKEQENGELAQTYCGTPGFISPEIHRGAHRVPNRYDARASDMWATGMTLYFLLTRSIPRETDPLPAYQAVTQSNAFSGLSRAAQDLIKKLLTFNPADRLTANNGLKHPWLQT